MARLQPAAGHRITSTPREQAQASPVLNLWPQPWDQAKRDDKIEYQLYERACRGIGRPSTITAAVRWEKRWKHRQG